MDIKANISHKGKSYSASVAASDAKILLYQKKIGDKIFGDALGLAGYELLITGGSDRAGFPMRKGIIGMGRKKILTGYGAGFRPLDKRLIMRRTVCGLQVYDETAQVNFKVVKEGAKKLEEIFVKEQKAENVEAKAS